jgi:Tfp pilus assembly protein PilF
VLHYAKWQLIGVALALLTVTAVALLTRKTRPYWLAGWFWFLITLIPVLNLLQSGSQPMADRYMYIPSIGLWMLFCWEAYDVAAAWPSGQLALRGLCAVLLAACCVASALQLRVWRNEGTLLARIPDSNANAVAHADYAGYLMRHHEFPQAEAEAEKASSIAPDRAAFMLLLGQIFLVEHKPDQAIEKLQAALRLERGMDVARLELGQAFLEKGQVNDAAEEFKSVLQRDPKNFVAHHWLARTFLAQGKTAEGAGEYRASLAARPNQPITLNDLAWLLATDPHPEVRRGTEAVKLADRACELTHWQEPALLGTLAAAYAEAGDFEKAVLAGQKAHDLAAAQGLKDLAQTNLQLIALYRDRKPFHVKP